MGGERIDLPQGTLDLLILKALALEAQHGWGISERILQISSDVLRIQQGSLYPALHRLEQTSDNLLSINHGTLYPVLLKLEQEGAIASEWGVSDNNRRAKFYRITRSGRKQLEAEESAWKKLAAAVGQVLGTA